MAKQLEDAPLALHWALTISLAGTTSTLLALLIPAFTRYLDAIVVAPAHELASQAVAAVPLLFAGAAACVSVTYLQASQAALRKRL